MAKYAMDVPAQQLTTHIMEDVKVAARESISGYMLASMEVHQVPRMCDEIAFRLVASVAAEVLRPKTDADCTVQFDFETPAGWWQHFKRDCFPSWLLHRFPVKLVTFEATKRMRVEVMATYPKLNTVFPPGENRHVIQTFASDTGMGTCEIKVTEKPGA